MTSNIKLKNIGQSVVLLLFVSTPFVLSAAGLVPCDGSTTSPCGFSQFVLLIQNVINFLMFDVAAPLAAIVFAWAGIIMFTAGGSPEKIKQATEIFQWVLIGILVALSGWLVVSTIMGTLLGESISGFVQQNFLSF